MASPLADMRTGWWSFPLPGYRDQPEPTTYSLFSYEQLPQIEAPGHAGWDWLASHPPQREWSLSANSYPDGSRADLSRLRSLIGQVPFALPLEFVTFFEAPSLHSRIRSCTACMLELSDFPVCTTAPPDGVIVQFLVDQQGVLRWYLFADPQGNQAVLASGEAYGLNYGPDETPRTEVNLFIEDFWLCAPSFSEFIYRFWLENEVWFALAEGRQPTTPQQRDYLNHYR
jgi:hypothetical protein